MAINYSIWNQEDAGEDVKLADVQATDGGVGLKMFDDAGYVWEFDGVLPALAFVRGMGWPCAYLVRERAA